MRPSKITLKQQSLRHERLARQASLSNRKVKAQSLAKQGISMQEPEPMRRNLEDDLADEAYQLSEAQKNTKRLVEDLEEAAILLNKLRENDVILEFNEQFPKIFREIKTKFGRLTGNQAYNEIVAILTHANEPVSNKNFAQLLNAMFQDVKRDMQNAKSSSTHSQLEDEMLKLDAMQKTYKKLSKHSQKLLESIPKDKESFIDFVDEGELNRLFEEDRQEINEYGNINDIDDDIIVEDASDEDDDEDDDNNDALIRSTTARDIDEIFRIGNQEAISRLAEYLGKRPKDLKTSYSRYGAKNIMKWIHN